MVRRKKGHVNKFQAAYPVQVSSTTHVLNEFFLLKLPQIDAVGHFELYLGKFTKILVSIRF